MQYGKVLNYFICCVSSLEAHNIKAVKVMVAQLFTYFFWNNFAGCCVNTDERTNSRIEVFL